MSTEFGVIILLFAFAFWLEYRGGKATTEALKTVSDANCTLAEHARQAQVALALVKGVQPHHVAPETFTPRGVSWETVERIKSEQSQNSVIHSDEVAMYEQAAEELTKRGLEDRASEMRERLSVAKKRVGMNG